MKDRIFVYGTLKKGFGNAQWFLSDSQFLGNATVKGQLLNIVGSFPGLIGSDDQKSMVHGEVYLVDNPTLARLDHLENEGILYHRKSTIAQMTTNCKGDDYQGQKAKVVWTYFWGKSQSQNFPIITSGNWE